MHELITLNLLDHAPKKVQDRLKEFFICLDIDPSSGGVIITAYSHGNKVLDFQKTLTLPVLQ